MWAWQDGSFGGWWHPMLGMFFMVLVILVIACVIMLILRRRGHFAMPYMPMAQHGDSALTILRERFARCELNKDDFDRMRKDLGG